jgi:hypothetical protein
VLAAMLVTPSCTGNLPDWKPATATDRLPFPVIVGDGYPIAVELPPAAPQVLSSPPEPPPLAFEGRSRWQPPDVPRRPFFRRIERWRPLVQELLAEAWDEGRLDGLASSLDDDLVLSLIQQESGGNPDAVSWAGALGLMQVMPFTFAEMMHGDKSMADLMEADAMFDPASNVRAGIRYLAKAMQVHEGNFYWALAAYNAGIEAVDRWRGAGLYAVPPLGGYLETADYTQIVLRTYLAHRPDVQMYVPDPMPWDHVPGAIQLLRESRRW